MKTIYLSGKITGCPDMNRNKFSCTEIILAYRLGVGVINPHKLPDNHDKQWASYMKRDIAALLTCDSVAVLDDWKQSPGAIWEVLTALLFRIPVFYAHELVKGLRIEVKPSKREILWLFLKVLVKRY